MIVKPAYILERKWYCPRWLFRRMTSKNTFWVKATPCTPDHEIINFLRNGPQDNLLQTLAHGVRGKMFWQPKKRRFAVPIVFAETAGSGDVGRWLDELPSFPIETVIMGCTSDIMVGMLLRRDWYPTWEMDSLRSGMIDIWRHRKFINPGRFDRSPKMRLYQDWWSQYLANMLVRKERLVLEIEIKSLTAGMA